MAEVKGGCFKYARPVSAAVIYAACSGFPLSYSFELMVIFNRCEIKLAEDLD